MEHLPLDLISHIGHFLSFEDRESCLLANKCFKPINYSYTYHTWVINTTFENKLNALLKLKPIVNTLMINCSNLLYLSEDDLAKDLNNITSKITNVKLKIKANNPYFRFILLNKAFVFKHIEVSVVETQELFTLGEIFEAREDITIQELTLFSFSFNAMQILIPMSYRIKENLNIYERSIDYYLDDVDVKALHNIPKLNLTINGCYFNLSLTATYLKLYWT